MNITNFKNESSKKSILILGGIHGNEVTPLVCIKNLINRFNKVYDESYYNLTFINCVNRSGLISNTRNITKISTEDLNRKFAPQNNHDLDFDTLKHHIDQSDVIIDIHSSPNCTELCLLNIDKTTKSYIEFLENLGIAYCCRYSSEDTIKKYCLDSGKIAFTVELNGITFVDENSANVGSFLVHDIIKNIKNLNIKHDTFHDIKEIITIKSPGEGLFYITKNLNEVFYVGEKIGYILSLNTFSKIPVIANISGKVICANDKQYYKFAEPILEVQPI